MENFPNSVNSYAVAPRDRGSAWLAAATVWTLIVLMIVPEGFDYSLLLTGRAPTSGDFLSRILWIGLLATSSAIVLWRAGIAGLLLRHLNLFLTLFVIAALASIIWSVDPRLTTRRDIRLVTIVLVCVAFAVSGWHARRLQSVVRPILTIMLVGSIVFGVVAPELGIHQEKAPELLGAWRGLTNHKNSLGALAGVTFLFWLHAWTAREVRAFRALAGCVLAMVCLWLSRSATSFIATLFAAIALGLFAKWPQPLRPYLKYAVGLGVILLMIYALAMLHLIPGGRVLFLPITTLTGDATFTGRSNIWTIVTDHMQTSPLVGSGYGAYWAGPDPRSPSYAFITKMNGFYPGSSHNGYLEVGNDLGWVGLICLFGYMSVYIRQSLKTLLIDRPQGVLFLTLFMQQAVANLSESHWFSVLSVQFVLMTLATTALARTLLEQRLLWRRAAAMSASTLSGSNVAGSAAAWQMQRRRA